MHVKLNTGLLPIINVGMYESLLSPDEVFGDWLPSSCIHNSMKKDEIEYLLEASWNHFNFEAYKKVVAKYAMEHVADFFHEIEDIVSVTLCKNAQIYSPRQYNFSTDELDFEIEVSEDEIQKIKIATKDNQKFFDWLKDTYKSYSGCVCFMPSDKDSYNKAIEGSDIERALAAYLTFLLREVLSYSREEAFSAQYSVYDDIISNHCIEEFIEDERFHEIMEKAYSLEDAM